ncbi:MAG: GGDEF domain-containing protein [Phycisphaerae bacterium]
MTLTFILPWFPIILGVGVGGRLLSRTHGYALGILAASFWLLLVHASDASAIWSDPWSTLSALSGVLSIVSMGGWAGETGAGRGSSVGRQQPRDQSEHISAQREEEQSALDRLLFVMNQFTGWLDAHRDDSDPWCHFDDFLRSAMYECCRASHVKPFRLTADGAELRPLCEPDPFRETQPFSARQGIVGHVLTTGRSYAASDSTQGDLVLQLGEESAESIAWCFAIREGSRRIGVVVAGQLELDADRHRRLLRIAEHLIGQWWCRLLEVAQSRAALLDDPVSGAYTREAFLRLAHQSLSYSYKQNEPVAVAVVAVENLRIFNDSGRWETADEIIKRVGGVLRRKVRLDDRLGRFDGSRFIILLRRVDSELATLIISQIMSQLTACCDAPERNEPQVRIRCGIVGSGTATPTLRELVSRALMQCRRAREDDLQISSDLQYEPVSSGIR